MTRARRQQAHRVGLLASGMMVLILGCNGAAEPVTDAGVPDAGPTLALPAWEACPDGWIAEAFEGTATCAPPPRVACAGGTFQRVGSPTCEPVDDGCGSGRFRPVLSADRPFVYVDPSATASGDGSESAPLRTLEEALAMGSPLGVALAEGEYVVPSALPPDLALYGVCAERVRLRSPAGGRALLVAPDQDVRLVGVTVTGEGVGIAVRGALTLDRVILSSLGTFGVGLVSGSLEGQRVLVRDVALSAEGRFGRGVSLEGGATATLTDVVIEAAHEAGIAVGGGAQLTASRVAVLRTLPNAEGRLGVGLSVFDGASAATMRDSLVLNAAEAGVIAQVDPGEPTATLTLERVHVEDITGEPAGTSGEGVELRGAQGLLREVTIVRSTGSGVLASAGAQLTLADVLVREVRLRDGFASGLASLTSASVELDRVALFDTAWVSVVVDGASLVARDLLVRRVASSLDLGLGLSVRAGSRADVRSFEIDRARTVGVMVSGEGALAHLERGYIHDIGETEGYLLGRGAEVDVGARIELTGVRIERVIETGVLAFGGLVPGTEAVLEDVQIREVGERSCSASTCPTEAGGTAVASLFGASILADALFVEGASLCGVQVADGSSLDVRSGEIARSAIGACVQVEGYDLTRVVAGVRFVENERNLETAGVYVPARGPTF